MLRDQRFEIGKDVTSIKSSLINDNLLKGFQKKDDIQWRIGVKQWLVECDSRLLDISILKQIIISGLKNEGIDVDDDFTPSQHYKLCADKAIYGKERRQRFYMGYGPIKNKSLTWLCVEYTSDKKYLKNTPFVYVRVWGFHSKERLDKFMDEITY